MLIVSRMCIGQNGMRLHNNDSVTWLAVTCGDDEMHAIRKQFMRIQISELKDNFPMNRNISISLGRMTSTMMMMMIIMWFDGCASCANGLPNLIPYFVHPIPCNSDSSVSQRT